MDLPSFSFVKPQSKEKLSAACLKNFENCIVSDEINCGTLKMQKLLSGIYLIDNFLSPEECKSLIEFIDVDPHLTFWNNNLEIIDFAKAKTFRDAYTIECKSKSIAERFWERLKSNNIKFDDVLISESDDRDKGTTGNWIAHSINDDLLFAKYFSNGFFSPHTDGNAIKSFNLRSFLSVIIFLEDIDDGGGTRFYKDAALTNLKLQNDKNYVNERWTCDRSLELLEVESKVGRMLIFDQQLVHEGVPVGLNFTKHIIRTDIMFKRDKSICDSSDDIFAYELFRKAEEIAEEGNIDESIKYFKKAFKISPALAELLGYS